MLEKLMSGLDQIESMSLEDLRDWEKLIPVIQSVGLYGEPYQLYGKDEIYVNPDQEGLWQIPTQLAKTLVFLSDFKIGKMVEIGTFQGWTCALMTCYLRRFNPTISVLTIDPHFYFSYFEEVQSRLPIQYVHITSQALKHCRFDLVFIDGDHTYKEVMADYRNVGINSPICLFHDIINDICTWADPDGSVARAWAEIKSLEPDNTWTEILDHSEGYNYMGFGIRVQAGTQRQ